MTESYYVALTESTRKRTDAQLSNYRSQFWFDLCDIEADYEEVPVIVLIFHPFLGL